MSEQFERRLTGQPVSPGIAMGVLRVEARGCEAPATRMILPTEMEQEWQRFEQALSRTEAELHSLKARVAKLSGAAEAAIFDAHLLFLRDRTILNKLRQELPARMHNIDAVYYAVVQNFMEVMRRVDDPYLRSRVVDIADVLQRVLKNMRPTEEAPGARSLCEQCPCVLAAYDLTPSDTADLDPNKVLGFVTETGSAVSHTAILARSLGLPAVVAVPRLVMDSRAGQQVILDGYNGELILNPTPETKEYYLALQQEKEKAMEAARREGTEAVLKADAELRAKYH